MDSIVLHIEYLLRSHDYVILPGFGAFIAHRESARFVAHSNSFLPPTRHISFNADIVNDDGLLVNSIRRKLSLDYDEARTLMSRSISLIWKSLKEDKEVCLGKIGKLTLSRENKISFSQAVSPETKASLLGNPTIIIPTETIDQKNEELGEKFVGHNTHKFNPAYYYIPVNKKFAKIAASLIIVVTVVLSILNPLSVDDREIVEASLIPGKEIIAKQVLSNPPVAKTSENNIPTKPSSTKTKSETDYHLIVASFHSPQEADKFLSDHSDSKYPLQIRRTKTLWLVSAQRNDDKDILLSLSNSSDFREEFKESWVWKKR